MSTTIRKRDDARAQDGADAGPRREDTRASESFEVNECPLHTAMRQVAEAAVTQHVLYAEGVYTPREGLAHEMQTWLRVHELIWQSICPATRSGNAPAPDDLEIALAGLPAAMRVKVAAAIRVCGRATPGEGCPLTNRPPDDLL
jgi:hypothetical protein